MSHDNGPKLKVSALKYSMGLTTVDNKIKKLGELLKAHAESYRGKGVKISPAYHNRIKEPSKEYTHIAAWEMDR